MSRTNRIRLNELEESFYALAEKYMLDVRDIELIFIEALVMTYGCEDIELVNEGIAVRRGRQFKYYNIKMTTFKQILDYFDRECNRRGMKKIVDNLELLLAQNNYMIYAKLMYKDAYGYELQPMATKQEILKYVEPIYIERTDGTVIPEHIQILPIELKVRSKQQDTQNKMLAYKADYMSKNLAQLHLEKIIKELNQKNTAPIALRVSYYRDGTLYIKDTSKERRLHYRLVMHIVNYFNQFQVKAIVKTQMDRG